LTLSPDSWPCLKVRTLIYLKQVDSSTDLKGVKIPDISSCKMNIVVSDGMRGEMKSRRREHDPEFEGKLKLLYLCSLKKNAFYSLSEL
jgi:hypothetical protein